MPQNRPIVEHGQASFTVILKVGRNDGAGRIFKIGKSIDERHGDIFDNIASHEESHVLPTSHSRMKAIVMPAADWKIIHLLLGILSSEGKLRVSKGTSEKVLFKLAKVCQMYNCTEKIRSLVDWKMAPDFAAENESERTCQPEEIYFIGKAFHLPKVLLIGWTRFVNRLYVEGGGWRAPMKIHNKRWRGLDSKDLSRCGRDPQWELLEEDTKEYIPGLAKTRLLELSSSVRREVIGEFGRSCQVRFDKYGRNPRGTNECQEMRIRGMYDLCRKLNVQSWESVDCEEYLRLELRENSVELLAAALVKGSRFELNAQHARCLQPRALLHPMLDRLLQSVPGPTPKLKERLCSLGDNRFSNCYWK